MSGILAHSNQPWPKLSYEEFKPSSHLLHMAVQVLGKLKLLTPFEPEWANVILYVSNRGLHTGPIPYQQGTFNVEINLITHQILCTTSWSKMAGFEMSAMSVAEFTQSLLATLQSIGVDIKINTKPQEVPNPIPFEEDTKPRPYEGKIINAWWRILVNSQRVFQIYHAKFLGKTQPIGLMWGTLDLRDVRYNGVRIKPTGINSGYIRRNAMDEAQIETGWWAGNQLYPQPAFYSFTYPQPKEIEKNAINPKTAHWDSSLNEFILDYEDVRKAKKPEQELLAFLESTYQTGSKLAGWNPNLIGTGKPI